jgi:hypothetical protein
LYAFSSLPCVLHAALQRWITLSIADQRHKLWSRWNIVFEHHVLLYMYNNYWSSGFRVNSCWAAPTLSPGSWSRGTHNNIFLSHNSNRVVRFMEVPSTQLQDIMACYIIIYCCYVFRLCADRASIIIMNCSLWTFSRPLFLSPSEVQTYFSAPCSQTLSFLNVTKHVSQPYKTIGKILVLCVLVFKLWYRRKEGKIFWTEL